MKTILTAIKSQLTGFFSIVLAFLIPIYGLILAVGCCIVADTIIGILRAKKLNGWKSVSSRRLSAIVSKMFLYEGALILFFFIDKFIIAEFTAMFIEIPLILTKILAATLCFIELKSIDENYKIIKGKSLWEEFKDLLARSKELKAEVSELKENEQPNQ